MSSMLIESLYFKSDKGYSSDIQWFQIRIIGFQVSADR
ncbi:hypothetical protein D1AOALGA4SA_2237 [Olavius algarvensis Delta 1 endosymbiont]|nr:hypothetical protein D1AOALGA4SA_2237 [Olavius algarvensis Delta 1 endosymbiont]